MGTTDIANHFHVSGFHRDHGRLCDARSLRWCSNLGPCSCYLKVGQPCSKILCRLQLGDSESGREYFREQCLRGERPHRSSPKIYQHPERTSNMRNLGRLGLSTMENPQLRIELSQFHGGLCSLSWPNRGNYDSRFLVSEN